MSQWPLLPHALRVPVPSPRALRVLRVPALAVALAVAATAAAPGLLSLGGGQHRVVVGDTLSELALANGTTVRAIQQLNGLTNDTIVLGQLLLLPGANGDSSDATGGPAGSAAATVASGTTTTRYTVRLGDTLTDIAIRAGTTMTAIRALNPLPSDGTVILGATLLLPASSDPAVAGAPAGTLAPATGAYGPGIARSRAVLAARALPSRAATQELIRAEAGRQGVPASLALAVAYQESGFTQASVSRTDAVGVMQLMPDTAAWVGPAVLGRTLDRYDVRDNIAGGVALLRALLRVVDAPTAVASYYQGLARTQRHGLLPDTRLYVASVLALQSRFR